MTANDSCIAARAHAFSEIFLNAGCWNPPKLQKTFPTLKNYFSAPKISDALPFITDSKVLFFHSQIYTYIYAQKHKAHIQIHVYILDLYTFTGQKIIQWKRDSIGTVIKVSQVNFSNFSGWSFIKTFQNKFQEKSIFYSIISQTCWNSGLLPCGLPQSTKHVFF